MAKQTTTLGEFLNHQRLQKKVTFAELAKSCNMATPTIWKVIKDKARPKDLTLQALSESLGIPLQELFRMRDKTRYPSTKRRSRKAAEENYQNQPVGKEELIELIQNSKLSDHTIEAVYGLIQSIS
ncbi:MAG: helix-turn-helix transcriptional regulator [Caldisericales bacterium]|nr:helix-turn-helix transcriptional regulator [Caldisericales bacterium]